MTEMLPAPWYEQPGAFSTIEADYLAVKAAIDASVMKVGPHGYIHGWIKVGDSGAASQHGRDVAGDLGGGRGVVTGTYNHSHGTVTDAGGHEHKVEAINGDRNAAGFHGETSRLPAGVRGPVEAYDRAIREGRQTEAPGITRVPSGKPTAGKVPVPAPAGHQPPAAAPLKEPRGSAAGFTNLPASTAAAINAYDEALRQGRQTQAPGVRTGLTGTPPHGILTGKGVLEADYETMKQHIVADRAAGILAAANVHPYDDLG